MKKIIMSSVVVAGMLFSSVSADTISKQEKQLAKVNYKLPSPFTMCAAFEKASPNVQWSKYVTIKSAKIYDSLPKISYNLGMQISTAYLLFNDKKLSSTNFDAIVRLSDDLGISDTMTKRIKTIKQALRHNDKVVLKNELIMLSNDVEKSLNSNERLDLAVAMQVGAWINAINSTTKYLSVHYTKAGAEFVAQKRLVVALYKRLEKRNSLVFDTTTIKVINSLKDIEKVIGSKKSLSKKDIKEINYITSKLVNQITAE